MANKKISELPPATLPLSGTELLEIVQGGINKQVAKDDVTTGVGTVTSVTGTTNRITSSGGATPVIDIDPAYDAAILAAALAAAPGSQERVITGTDSCVQADNDKLIVFNSATPFNFTIDTLTIGSKFGWVNYGAGAVTFLNGAGVTIDGSTTAPGKSGNTFSSGLIDFTLSATVPKSVTGEAPGGGDRLAVVINTGTLTLDVNNQRERNFDLTATVSSAFALTVSNTGSWIRSRLTLRVTGAVAVTLDAACIMDTFEVSNGRWVSGTNVLTLTGVTASPFMLEFVPDSAGNIWVFATNNGV